MNRWEGLDEFVAVAETGQLTAATERIGVSSSHISRQVARLEERLQTHLLYRSTRQVSLNEAGQTFLQHCQCLQDAHDEALRAVSDLSAEPKGLLRMTCAVAYGERFIVPLVNVFMTDYPQPQVDIELSSRQLDLSHEGFDLAVRLDRLSDLRSVATRLTLRVMYLCATPEYLRHYGIPRLSVELGQFSCLIGSSDLWGFLEDGRETQHQAQDNWCCNNGQTVSDAVLCDSGLCQLPDYYVIEHLRNGHLVSLPKDYQPSNTAVWTLCPQQWHLSSKVRQLVDYLKEGLAQSHPGLAGEKDLH